MKRHIFTPAERDEIWKHDSLPLFPNKAVCRLCGGIVDRNENWHVAHEEPVSSKLWIILPRGWRDAEWNVGVAHARCNIRAGNKPMTVWQSLSLRTKLKLLTITIIILAALAVAH